MRHYINAFKTEWLKLKRSGTFWICIGAGAFVPILQTIGSFVVDFNDGAQDNDAWNNFIRTNFTAFAGFFFPVFLVIIVARIVYLEHRSDTWKLLETQPVPRLALFIAKFKISILISLFCLLAVLVFSLAGGFLVQAFKPKNALEKSSIDMLLISKVIIRYWVASFGLIAIQYFFGLWNKSFALPLAIGLVATITGSILSGFNIWTWWPYSAPSFTSSSFKGSLSGNFFMHHEKMSILWAALFLLAGYQLYVRKNFIKAVFVPIKRLASAIGVLLLFVLIAYYINKPVTLGRYNSTVIAGKITSEKPVTSVIVLQQPANDTILNIPVVNGNFHGVISGKPDAAIYTLRTGSIQAPVYFGSNDSTYIDLDVNKQFQNIKVSGTRVAENEYLNKEERDYTLYSLSNYAYDYKPEDYANELLNVWDDGIKKINEYKTSDNIKPSGDFIQVQEKLLAIKLLKLAEVTYPQVYNLYYPNEKYTFPEKLSKLKQYADINDEGLTSYSYFTDYLTETFRAKSGPNDSIYFQIINNDVKNEKVKDVLYYETLNATLSKVRDSSLRNFYLSKFIGLIKNPRFQKQLIVTNTRFNNLQRGKKAYIFTGEALNGNDIILAQLANKYVVIDVWATWCGPCKKETPYFEELAEKYGSDNVVFVGLSIDENKMAWKLEAPQKSKRVLQLWAKNGGEDFNREYAISSIPRFMLIDPSGNIVDANLPRPSDPEFLKILQSEIPGFMQRHY